MRYLLDANTCIAAMRGHPLVLQRLALAAPGDCAISTITRYELWVGVEKSADPVKEKAKVDVTVGCTTTTSAMPTMGGTRPRQERPSSINFPKMSYSKSSQPMPDPRNPARVAPTGVHRFPFPIRMPIMIFYHGDPRLVAFLPVEPRTVCENYSNGQTINFPNSDLFNHYSRAISLLAWPTKQILNFLQGHPMANSVGVFQRYARLWRTPRRKPANRGGHHNN
jgi:hypothetical protein